MLRRQVMAFCFGVATLGVVYGVVLATFWLIGLSAAQNLGFAGAWTASIVSLWVLMTIGFSVAIARDI